MCVCVCVRARACVRACKIGRVSVRGVGGAGYGGGGGSFQIDMQFAALYA